jgi:hypothetical protein
MQACSALLLQQRCSSCNVCVGNGDKRILGPGTVLLQILQQHFMNDDAAMKITQSSPFCYDAAADQRGCFG